ncbi:MAG: hypothetical protein HQL23_01100 [Candidatus Omnitrophica bacterium]|nr:hypothetical protein [Candidatus Omnitrophota bacterium]
MKKFTVVCDGRDVFLSVMPGAMASPAAFDILLLSAQSDLRPFIQDFCSNHAQTACRFLDNTGRIADCQNDFTVRYARFIAGFSRQLRQQSAPQLETYFSVNPDFSLWWPSLVYEKSPLKTDVFRRLFLIESVIKACEDAPRPNVILAVADQEVREVLARYFLKAGLNVIQPPNSAGAKIRKWIKNLFNYWRDHWQGLACILREIKWNRLTRNLLRRTLRPQHGDVLLVTYYPAMDLQQARSGVYQNDYFNPLPQALAAAGKKCVWLAINIYHPKISPAEGILFGKQLNAANTPFYFLHEFISLPMIARSVFQNFRLARKLRRIQRQVDQAFDEWRPGAYAVVKEDWESSFGGIVGFKNILFGYAFQKAFSYLSAAKCLYPLEMSGWEKTMLAANQTQGRMTAFGYQHSTVSPMWMSNYFSGAEHTARPCPRPDHILCNGPRTAALFQQRFGWAARDLNVVEAVRYFSLIPLLREPLREKKPAVLFALSLIEKEARVFIKIGLAYARRQNAYPVWFKFHPLMPIEPILKSMGLSSANVPFEIKQEPIAALLEQAKVVVVGQTGVALQAVAQGCRVINLRSLDFFNLPAIDSGESFLVGQAGSLEELTLGVERRMRQQEDPSAVDQERRRVIGSFFLLPPDPDQVNAFAQHLFRRSSEKGQGIL